MTNVPSKPPSATGSRQRLASNFVWNLSASGWGILLALVSTPLVVGGLGVVLFGAYALLRVLLSYLAFAELGLSKAVERHSAAALGADEPDRVTTYFGTALCLQVCIASLVGGVVALAGPPVLHLFEIPAEHLVDARDAIRWFGLNMAVNFVAGIPQALLQAHQRFPLLNRISVLSQTVLTALVVGAALYYGSLVAVVQALVAGTALRTVLLFATGLRLLRPTRLVFDRDSLRELLRFGGPLTFASVVAPVLAHAEKLMLGALVSAASLTFYIVPFRVLGRMSLVSAALRRALFPILSVQEGRGDMKALKAMNLRATELLAWLLLPAFAVFWLAGDTLLALWMGADFAARSAPVLPFLTLGTFFNLLALNAVALIQARGRPGLIAYLYVIELVLYLPSAWWAMSRFGVAGAAAAWCGRVLLDFALLWYIALWLVPGRRRVSAVRLRPLFLGVVTYTVCLLLGNSIHNTAADLVVAALVAAGLGLAAVVWGLDGYERTALLAMLRRGTARDRPA